jgi:hypothetical protein
MAERHKITPYPLRMPTDIREWAQQKAREEDRSMNQFIVRCLRQRREGEQQAAA